ncbi:oxygen-independent coproporphyrinogen III oxidase [Mangrovitalea sediminis]|uniref:oxygen-independent coproporphyrinogen III oxidase n=1 Tax=Mangrovitalea sediminis TaxID=1982043 RepID=UPI000BE505BA|nr:oxygen-independent coproporphyrinogen III oxidase [Mangrovitalea sediminis]
MSEFQPRVSFDHLEWDDALIARYDRAGPRYTSYPTAVEFTEAFGVKDLERATALSREHGNPLSLYVHVPFCARLCYYCGCNKIVTKRREKAAPYLERLYREAAIQSSLFGNDRPVEQLHLGGGTPTFLSDEQLREVMATLSRYFRIEPGKGMDYSIEIDPREMRTDTLGVLRDLGFNRISMGVQDFDPLVQQAVNRIQPPEMTMSQIARARELGFGSINIDLIYGLPLQTPDSFAHTLDKVLSIRPDRLSVFNYAHMPERFKPQRRIQREDLPSAADKLTILKQTIATLMAAGYQYIGMDHFALPTDSLAIAQRNGELHRNFQGYTTHGHCDLVGLGVSAIGQTDDACFQNHHDQALYEEAIDSGKLPIKRGLWLDEDDKLRRWVIQQLICHDHLDMTQFQRRWAQDFGHYFSDIAPYLTQMADDGLLTWNAEQLVIQPKGRLLVRAICQIFDRYRTQTEVQRFSRII